MKQNRLIARGASTKWYNCAKSPSPNAWKRLETSRRRRAKLHAQYARFGEAMAAQLFGSGGVN